MAYDAPESSEDRDALGRWSLASNVFDLIRGVPGTWSLRIGIYGRWGEGKTTVLKFIETLARNDDYRIAWFNPWAAETREQLWGAFAASLDESFKQPLKLQGKRGFLALADWGSELASAASIINPLAKVAPSIIKRLSRHLAVKRSDIEPLLKNMGNKKLIVFIDDLDRAKPDLVPYLLLSLRELLELPQCAFIMALDPYVVAKALPAVHPGWGSTPEFMEKIIDYPFWISTVGADHKLALANTQLNIGSHRIPESIVVDISAMLPSNPRQLKLFFRKLWRLKTVLDRHEDEEIAWKLLLILELARNVSFKAAEQLFSNHAFTEQLFQSAWKGKILEDKTFGEDKWVTILKETIAGLKDDETIDQEELIRIFTSLKTQTTLLTKSNFQYWAKVVNTPPSMTWKEFKRLLKSWEAEPNEKRLRTLIEEHATALQHPLRIVTAEFFDALVAYRGKQLDAAATSRTDDELISEMRIATKTLNCISVLATDLHGFEDTKFGLGLKEYQKLYAHCQKWAHFRNHPIYIQARDQESQLLKRAASDGVRFAPAFLETLKIWNDSHEIFREGNTLRDEVIQVFLPAIHADLIERFSTRDGISSLWPKDSHLVEKTVLFDKNYRFYSSEMIDKLRGIARSAHESEIVQVNFLEYLNLLAYGFQRILSPLSADVLRPLAKDREIIDIAWSAATARRLQPRVIGSLEETRKLLEEVSGTPIPVPKWASDVLPTNVQEAASASPDQELAE